MHPSRLHSVAGSAGYGNYRHQSDVCHAYQVVRSKGIPASNIIVMAVDDVANNRENPYPGELSNLLAARSTAAIPRPAPKPQSSQSSCRTVFRIPI